VVSPSPALRRHGDAIVCLLVCKNNKFSASIGLRRAKNAFGVWRFLANLAARPFFNGLTDGRQYYHTSALSNSNGASQPKDTVTMVSAGNLPWSSRYP